MKKEKKLYSKTRLVVTAAVSGAVGFALGVFGKKYILSSDLHKVETDEKHPIKPEDLEQNHAETSKEETTSIISEVQAESIEDVVKEEGTAETENTKESDSVVIPEEISVEEYEQQEEQEEEPVENKVVPLPVTEDQSKKLSMEDIENDEPVHVLMKGLYSILDQKFGEYDDRYTVVDLIDTVRTGIETEDDMETFKKIVSKTILAVNNGLSLDEVCEQIRAYPFSKKGFTKLLEKETA